MKVRRLGVDLSEARLKAIALELGITKVYSTMTQAEKAQLRYHAIMTQTTKAQGDMARTLDAPANQLRILQAAATQAARAIGNVFIPILNAILPYAIAAANAVRIIASAFASLLGFSMPSVDYSGLSGAANAAGELNENLGGAGGSAKELKNVLMGFDEINKLPDASGGGGGGGGGALLDSFNFDLLEYDFLGDAVNSRVQEIMKSIKPMLDFVKRNADDILQIAKAVGVAFLEWKFVKRFVPDLMFANKYIKNIGAVLAGLTTGVITIALGFKFTQDFLENSTDGDLDWGSLIASGLTTAFGSAVTGLTISKATGSSKMGWIATGAVLTISAVTDMKLQYGEVLKGNGWSKDLLITDIKKMLELAVGGGVIGFGLGGVTGAGIGAIAGLTVSLISTAYLIFKAANAKIDAEAKRQMEVDILKEKLKLEQFVEEQLNFNMLHAKFEALDATLTLSEEAKKNLTNSVVEFSNSLNLLQLGVDTVNTKRNLIEQLTSTDGIIPSVNTYLKSEEARLKAIIEIVPPVASDGDTNFASNLFGVGSEFYSTTQESISVLGETLAELLEKSFTTKLTEQEAALAKSISEMFANVGIMTRQQAVAAEFYKSVNSIDWTDLNEASYIEAINLLSEEYNKAIEKFQLISDEGKADLLATKTFAENYVLSNLKLKYELSSDADEKKYLDTLIKQQQKVIADYEAQLNNWDTTNSAKKAGEAMLQPYVEGVQEASKTLFPEIFNTTKEEMEKAVKELNEYAEAIDFAVDDNWVTRFYHGVFGLIGGYDSNVVFENSEKIKYADKIKSAVNNTFDMFGSMFKFGDSSGYGGKADTNNPFVTQIEQVATEATEAFTSTLGEGIQQGVNTAFDGVTFFGASGGGGNSGGNTGIVAKAQEVGKQTSDAFVGAVEDGMKKVNELGSESSFSGLRTQLNGAATDAKGITEAINEIPTNHAINLYIAGYSTLINRINNIATKVRSISSTTINIKIRAGIEPGSKQFLLQLARISPGAALSNKLISLVNMSMFAKGGFPAHGDIFIANENGPELVGRIGNKTAVANEDQIGDTILSYMEQAETSSGSSSIDEERLANVLVRALRSAGVGAVRIDGKDIARSLNRETQRTGHTPLTIK